MADTTTKKNVNLTSAVVGAVIGGAVVAAAQHPEVKKTAKKMFDGAKKFKEQAMKKADELDKKTQAVKEDLKNEIQSKDTTKTRKTTMYS